MKAIRMRCLLLLSVLLFTGLVASAETAAQLPTAIYEHGHLSLQIPFHSPRIGLEGSP
jgi:hypothetical protein